MAEIQNIIELTFTESDGSAFAASALESANNAAESATDAFRYASAASNNAEESSESATQASNSASDAINAKTNAETAAQQAATSAANAATSETNASNSATSASASAATATTKASEASQSATAASNTLVSVINNKNQTQQYYIDAMSYAGSAERSASDAQNSAFQADQSAQAASTSATNASTSANNAASSATTANSAADDATAAKTAAETAKTSAQQSATSAATSAQIAQDVLESIPEDYSDLSESVEDLKSAFEEFPTGIYPDLTVGSLMSEEYTEEKMPYLYRVAGGGIEVGKVEADTIVGGTIAWNQIVQNGNFANGTTGWYKGSADISASNGEVEVTIADAWNNDVRQTKSIYTNHVYFIRFSAKGDEVLSGNIRATVTCVNSNAIYASTPPLTTSYQTREVLSKATSSPSGFRITLNENASEYIGQKYYAKNVNIIDLTQMFGTSVADYIYSLEQSTAGAGVAFFRSLFPNDYYPYNAGELMHVSGVSEHVARGFNQWDEEWEIGTINPNTGEKAGDSNYFRSKNFIPVIPGGTYYINAPASTAIRQFFYDKNKNYISWMYAQNYTVTVPSNCAYMMMRMLGTTYNHDICINLSSSRNGEYEPYEVHSYPLDSSLTLRGIPKLDSANNLYYDGDTYESDGTVTRKYGIVDLGSLAWNYGTLFSNGFLVGKAKPPVTHNVAGNILCTKYPNIARNSIADKCIAMQTDGSIVVSDSSYTDAATFKAAMSGVYLVYELATPTTETAEPYAEYQHVTNGGTEEYVSTGIVPVGHVTKYPADIVAKVDGLPSDFSTLIAPTEKEFTATRAYTVNDLLIINNTLYKVTASIASGATITPNTNVQQTTLSALIKALSA